MNLQLQNSRCKFLSSNSNSNYLIIFSGRCLRTGPFGTPTRGILFKITSAGSCIQNGKKIGAYSSQTLGCKTCQRISPHFLRFVTYFLNQFSQGLFKYYVSMFLTFLDPPTLPADVSISSTNMMSAFPHTHLPILGVSPSLVSRYCEGYSFLQATGPQV